MPLILSFSRQGRRDHLAPIVSNSTNVIQGNVKVGLDKSKLSPFPVPLSTVTSIFKCVTRRTSEGR